MISEIESLQLQTKLNYYAEQTILTRKRWLDGK